MLIRSGSVLPYPHVRSVRGVPWYKPYSESGGSTSISARSSALGSSSTTTARFFISRRKRAGIRVTASATRRSNSWRVIPAFVGAGFSRPERQVIVAILPYGAFRAERLRPANATAVQDLDVRRKRPHLLRQRTAQLRLHLDGILTLRDPD